MRRDHKICERDLHKYLRHSSVQIQFLKRRPKSEGRKGMSWIWWQYARTFDECREMSSTLQNRRKKSHRAQKNWSIPSFSRLLHCNSANRSQATRRFCRFCFLAWFGFRVSDFFRPSAFGLRISGSAGLRSFAASSLIGSRISGFGLRPSGLLS